MSRVSPLDAIELAELAGFLRIPSISTDPSRRVDVGHALEWVAAFVRDAGGAAEVVDVDGSGIVDGYLSASTDASAAPTVLCWGHVDVQPPTPTELWESDPFDPEIRDGWLYARGVADDKGQLWALLRAAANLSRAGALPVNVRFCCDGEEEIGGTAIVEFLGAQEEQADACVIFDTPMLDHETPTFTIGTRGTLYLHIEVSTGVRDLHSGVYGGAALNALHVLVSALANVTPREGRLPEALLTDASAVGPEEISTWSALPAGRDQLAAEGAAPADPAAGEEFYLRTWALPSLDVNGIEGGSPVQQKTIVTATARANLSMRLAQGQTVARLAPIVEAELRRGLPDAAKLDVSILSACDPGQVPSDSTAIRLASAAFAQTIGKRPLLLRTGGSLPLMPLLERLELPSVISGFAQPSSNLHAPNERMRMRDLERAISTAEAMLTAFRELSPLTDLRGRTW